MTRREKNVLPEIFSRPVSSKGVRGGRVVHVVADGLLEPSKRQKGKRPFDVLKHDFTR
jgi:hypothetical protein